MRRPFPLCPVRYVRRAVRPSVRLSTNLFDPERESRVNLCLPQLHSIFVLAVDRTGTKKPRKTELGDLQPEIELQECHLIGARERKQPSVEDFESADSRSRLTLTEQHSGSWRPKSTNNVLAPLIGPCVGCQKREQHKKEYFAEFRREPKDTVVDAVARRRHWAREENTFSPFQRLFKEQIFQPSASIDDTTHSTISFVKILVFLPTKKRNFVN